MPPKTRSKRRTPPPPTLRSLNPAYTLRKERLEDLGWFDVLGYTGNGWILIRASWPKDIGFATVQPKNIGNAHKLIEFVRTVAKDAPRANFGAPEIATYRKTVEVGTKGTETITIDTPTPAHWLGHWIMRPRVDVRKFPKDLIVNADFIQLATQKTWRKAASPDATWRAVYIASVQPEVAWCYALVDVDGTVAAIVAPTRSYQP